MAAFSATLAATGPLAPPLRLHPTEGASWQRTGTATLASLSKRISDLLLDQPDWDKAAVLRREDGGVVASTFFLEPNDVK